MKKYILILIYLYSFVSFSQTTFSDEFTFSTSVSVKSEYSGVLSSKEYIFDGNKYMVSVKLLNTKITVQRFDSETLKEISSNSYEDLPADSKIINLTRTNDKIILFYSTSFKSGNTIISARAVNNIDGTLLAPVKCIESIGRIAYFQFFQSIDKSKILIQYRKIPVNKLDKLNFDVLGFCSINSNLKVLSGTEVKMPFTENIFKPKTFGITNSGSIFLLAINLEINKIDLREITTGIAKKIPTEDLDSIFYKLKFNSVKMTENSEGNLIFNGFLMNGLDNKSELTGRGMSFSKDENVNGLFFFEISQSGKLIKKTIYEFPITLLNQNESNSSKNINNVNEKNDYAGITNLQITNVTLNADESILITGTQVKFNGMADFSLGHIIIYKIDNLGSLSWIIKIPRHEQAVSYFRYEFDLYQHENAIYILFPDVSKNNNINQIDAPQGYTEVSDSRNIILYKIDLTSGKYIRKTLIDINNINGLNCENYFVYNYVLVSPTEIIREVDAGKEKTVLVKMKLNE